MKKKKTTGSAMCGGVISQSMFDSSPMGYMMCFVMPDKWYKKYVALKDEKKQHQLFVKHARSII